MAKSLLCRLEFMGRQPFAWGRLAFVFALILMPFVPTMAKAQAVTQKSNSFYQTLDREYVQAKNTAGIRTLLLEIHNRNLFGPMPESVLDRMVRAQQGFLGGTRGPVTEAAVADAVNAMGHELDPVTFTGTNAMQVRLVRISLLPSFPNLLASGSPRPPDKMAANDLSPAGAAYLGVLILRQKLANPAWFGDPDAQNKRWALGRPKSAPNNNVVRVDEEPPEQTNLRLQLQKGLTTEGTKPVKAYHLFLDRLGLNK